MVKKINEFKELQKKKGKKGFSMIELIIVIAIMAILIALIGTQLIPYLEKTRKSKDLTTLDTCLSNFESALASTESTVEKGKIYGTSINGLPADIKSAYEEVAGAYDDTELGKALKSKEAKGGTVHFGTTADGICVVWVVGKDKEHGGLVACSAFSGTIEDFEAANYALPTDSI